MCKIYGALLHFVKNLHWLTNNFFAIHTVLSRFMCFWVEKNLAKFCACGEKLQISGMDSIPRIVVSLHNISYEMAHGIMSCVMFIEN